MVKRLPTMRETWVQALGWEDLLEKEMASLVDYSPWGHKESDTTEQLHFHFHIITALFERSNYAHALLIACIYA